MQLITLPLYIIPTMGVLLVMFLNIILFAQVRLIVHVLLRTLVTILKQLTKVSLQPQSHSWLHFPYQYAIAAVR